MKKLLVTSSILLLCMAWADATVYKTLILNDGFELKGYVMEEIPGESVKIHVDTIKGFIETNYVDKEEFRTNERNEPMVKIMLNNDGIIALGGDSNSKKVENNYRFNSLLGSVKINKKSSDRYDYEYAPKNGCGEYVVLDNSIKEMGTTPRSEDAARGLVDIIITQRGPLKGQIVHNDLGNTITIKDVTGVYQTIESSEIVCMEVEGLDEDEKDILRQAEYFDVVQTNDYETPLVGVITAKKYYDDDDKDEVIVHTVSGEDVHVSYNSISKFSYRKNPNFKPGKKYDVGNGEVWINGVEINSFEGDYAVSNGKYRIPIKPARQAATKFKYSQLEDGILVLEHKDESAFRNSFLLKMNPQKKSNNVDQEYYSFSNSELTEDNINLDTRSTTANGIVRTTYLIKKPRTTDYYILFFKDGKNSALYIISITN